MKNKIKMKRHESFTIREGWLTKGLLAIKNDETIFSSEFATDKLGIGSNMVKSLKYWLLASNLIEINRNSVQISELGKLILKYDPYMETDFSWWMIHINLIFNKEEFYVGNLFFNKIVAKTFSKEDIFKICSTNLDMKNIEYNEKILLDEINTIIKTYVVDKNNDTPENNFNCPLSNLELIKKISKDKYERVKPNNRMLNYLIIYYLTIIILDGRDYISFDDLVNSNNGLFRILNLDKNLTNEYLDDMRRSGLISINRTAGLNMIYLNEKMNLNQIFDKFFKEEL